MAEKRFCIEANNPELPVYRQCELLGLSKAAYYYKPRDKSGLNEELMRVIDEQYTRTPFYGVPKMTQWLKRQGYCVNRKRIRRLMKLLGLEAVYPKRNLSKPSKEHKKYPYLLRGISILRPDQVWSADITYIRLSRGFVYLVAVMDWHSRYILSWEVSTTLDKDFCIRALENALLMSKPEVFNTDQGSQFTSDDFTGVLESLGIKVSMDGRGRALDNIFVECLWRSVKYEEVYLHSYNTVKEAKTRLARYFHFYNTERIHQSLDYKTPTEVYFEKRTELKPRQTELHLNQPVFLS